jgi:hypothetical protein
MVMIPWTSRTTRISWKVQSPAISELLPLPLLYQLLKVFSFKEEINIMDKIPIKKIHKNVYDQKGFPSGPFDACLNCKCGYKGKK